MATFPDDKLSYDGLKSTPFDWATFVTADGCTRRAWVDVRYEMIVTALGGYPSHRRFSIEDPTAQIGAVCDRRHYKRVLGDKGVEYHEELTPAYERGRAEGIAQGRAEERADIVSWLRKHKQHRLDSYGWLAVQIDKGEHVKTEK